MAGEVKWRIVASAAGTVIVLLTGFLFTAFDKRLSAAESHIELKADKATVDRMYDDIKDIRDMLTSHVIESGSGRVSRRRTQ